MTQRTAGLLLVLLALTGVACSSGDTPGQGTPSASVPSEQSFPPCREDPMAHVHRPARLEIKSACTSVSGTVREVEPRNVDGDSKIFVEPDPEFAGLLAPSNNGLLVVEVIPTDRPSVFIPEAGQHATFYGSLVNDRNKDNWVEIHPAWLITTLDVTIDAPSAVPVGDKLTVSVDVSRTTRGTTSPVSLANLFVEMISADGEVVRWEAAQTNTAGFASLSFAALERAGGHTLFIHASQDHESGFTTAAFTIKRR